MTQQIDSILVPINDSRFSKSAFELAKKFRAEQIELYHEVPRWAPYVEDVLFPFAGLGEDKAAIEIEMIEHARQFYEKQFKIPNTIPLDIRFSEHDSTTEKLQRSPADLVIMGGSRDRVQQLGAFVQKVFSVPTKPTLVVKQKPVISKLLVPIDLSPQSARVLSFAAQLAVQLKVEMETLVVIPDGNDDVRELLQLNAALNRKKLIGKSRSRIDAMFERTLQQQQLQFGSFDALSPKLKRKKTLVGEPSRTVLEYAERSKADLIVIGASRESVQLGSIAFRILKNSTCNICVVNSE